MFLHSGASLHGHEYSNRPSPPANGGPRRSPLLRSPFAAPTTPSTAATPSSVARASTFADNSPRPAALKSSRPRSDYIPRPVEHCVRFQEPDYEKVPEPMSEDEVSASVISDSETSQTGEGVTRRRPRRKRSPRQITTYLFAHPAPKLGAKKRLITHTKPKLLMQVQQISAGKRPRPAIDVYPSSVVAGSVIAPLLSQFPRIARNRKELSFNDIMIVKSQDYDTPSIDADDEGDDEKLENRELIAILSPLKKEEKTEIVLADGTAWTAKSLANGSFEFVMYDQDGTPHTARWVRRSVARSTPQTPSSTAASPAVSSPSRSPSPTNDFRFNFSFIDPNSRRHPILASLTSSALEVHDTFTTLSASSSRQPPTSPINIPSSNYDPLTQTDSPSPERETQLVQNWMKTFISISAIWVALRQGWSPLYRRPIDNISVASSASPSVTSATAAAAASPNLNATCPITPVSRSRSTSIGSEQHQLPHTSRHRRIFSATSAHPETECRDLQPRAQASLPRRATSTGAAYIQNRSLTRHGVNKRASTMNSSESSAATVGPTTWTIVSDVPAFPSYSQPVASRADSTNGGFQPQPEMSLDTKVLALQPNESAPRDGIDGDIQLQNAAEGNDGAAVVGGHHHRWSRFTGWFKKLQAR